MFIKSVFFALSFIAIGAFFMHFWQSGNATSTDKIKTTAMVQQGSRLVKSKTEVVANLQNVEEDDKPAPVVEVKSHPSTSPELEGEIHNEYFIRDDVLASIEEMTRNNEKARRAAIKLANYDNQSYYHSLTSEEAIAWQSKSFLARWCLVMAEPDNWRAISEKITRIMADSPERKKHMDELEHRFFAWKALGSGLTQDEEKARCKAGVF